VRAVDTVSRLGGDEFVVLLGDMTTDPEQAADLANKLAEKVRLTLSRPYVIATGHEQETIKHECSASIGVVVFSKEHQNLEDLLKWADAAMYRSKADGRNRVSFLLERRATQRL
jgi:diguanylate cyclase (GGDEF)-like protein